MRRDTSFCSAWYALMYKIPGARTQVASKGFIALYVVATYLAHICLLCKLMSAVYTAKEDKGLHIDPEAREALISLGMLSQYSSGL